jgi:hypothetical protein
MNLAGWWFPITPGGTVLVELAAKSEQEAWRNLLIDIGHMYRSRAEAEASGYEVGQAEAADE